MTATFTGKQLLLQPLPNLSQGRKKTQSPALHNIKFVGRLYNWRGFEGRVISEWSQIRLKNDILGAVARSGAPDLFGRDFYQVGDEHGVQGRFCERVGQILGVIAANEGLDFSFADAKCTQLLSSGVPDFMLTNNNSAPFAVGELKVPWIREHSLKKAVSDFNSDVQGTLRGLLGQIAQYMEQNNLKYGVISTYDETIFLRQLVAYGKWRLEFSPVINHNNEFESPSPPNIVGSVTLRQSFFHFAKISLANREFERGQGISRDGRKWIRKGRR